MIELRVETDRRVLERERFELMNDDPLSRIDAEVFANELPFKVGAVALL